MGEKIIFDKTANPRRSDYFPYPGTPLIEPQDVLSQEYLRDELSLPSLGELDIVRHYSNLAKLNFCVDTNFYPLGSCTMKYNPKINETISSFEGFTSIHPYQREDMTQGALELLYDLECLLCEITGMKRFTFQPSSGAQGEFTGMLMIRKFHELKGNKKSKVIIPDSAHGTNPATASMCGYNTVVVNSNSEGLIDIEKLRSLADDEVAAIMLTNPNTLGLFEENILEIGKIIHDKGGLLYYDGANFNPLLGIVKPFLMGFDVVHLNFHKTFSTPHGCGGPGAGVVGVGDILKDFLPVPLVNKKNDKFYLDYEIKNSIGKVRSFYGNFNVLVKAYSYILRLGGDGLLRVAQNSVLNSRYIKEKLKKYYELAYSKDCMHEVVFTCEKQKERGASALDIAKRLIDFRIHPPTMYFPLIVKEALMVEPTETESKETLDNFIQIMIKINEEIDVSLEKLKNAPLTTPLRRVDEVNAARKPNVRWMKDKK